MATAITKTLSFGTTIGGGNRFVGHFNNIQLRRGYVLDLASADANQYHESWVPITYYQDTVDSLYIFPYSPFTSSDDDESSYYEPYGYGHVSHSRDPQFVAGNMDFRGYWRSLPVTSAIVDAKTYYQISSIAVTSYSEFTIEDAFPNITPADISTLSSIYSFAYAYNTRVRVFSVALSMTTSLYVDLITTDLNILQSGVYYKRATLTVKSDEITGMICTPSDTILLSFDNNGSDKFSFRLLIYMYHIPIYTSGSIEVKLFKLSSGTYNQVISCTASLDPALANAMMSNMINTGAGMYYLSEADPEFMQPGLFRINFGEITIIGGGAPRLNTITDCMNSVSPKAQFLMGTTKATHQALGCDPLYDQIRFGKCEPNEAVIAGCLASSRDDPSKCVKCKLEFYLTSANVCSSLSPNCLRGLGTYSSKCVRCKPGYVLTSISYYDIRCVLFSLATHPGKLYLPTIQSTMPLTKEVTTPFPLVLNTTSSLYTFSTTLTLTAFESSFAVHVSLHLVSTPAVSNLYSHLDFFFLLDGVIVQTRAVPYTVTNFALKTLEFDIISHHVEPGVHRLEVQGMYPAEITDWREGVQPYTYDDDCWFWVTSSQCLICNGYKSLFSNFGICLPYSSDGLTAVKGVTYDYASVYMSCKPNVKHCYISKVLECYPGYFIDNTGKNCITCNPSCPTCNGTEYNCTSCLAGSSLAKNTTGVDLAYCQPCPIYCLQCQDWTRHCTLCAPSYSFDSRQGCCPAGLVSTLLGDQCVHCDILRCDKCDADNHCAKCVDGFDLLAGGTMCGVGDRRVVTVTGMYNPRELTVDYFFSESVDLTKLEGRTSLEYERDYFEVEWTCTTAPVAIDGQQGRSCRNKINFIDLVQVVSQQIYLNVTSDIFDIPGVYIPKQRVKLGRKVDWYNNKDLTSGIKIYSRTASIATTTTVGLSSLTSANIFVSILRLTQHIEMIGFINVLSPFSLAAFLQFFSQDVIGMMFNPFSGLGVKDRCTAPTAFAVRSIECLYLESSGETLLIFVVVVGAKCLIQFLSTKIGFFKKINNYYTLCAVMAILDTLYFNVCIGAMINVRIGTGDSGSLGLLNLIISIFCLISLVLVTAFGYYYCAKSPYLKEELDIKMASINYLRGNIEGIAPRSKKAIILNPQQTIDQGADNKNFKSEPNKKGLKGLSTWFLSLDLMYFYQHMPSVHWTGRMAVPFEQTVIFLCSLFLVSLHDYPFYQLLSCTIVVLAELIVVMVKPKYIISKDNARLNTVNILLIITMAFMTTLTAQADGTVTPKGQYSIVGIGGIICLSILLFFSLITTLMEVYRTLISTFRFCRKRKEAEEELELENNKPLGQKASLKQSNTKFTKSTIMPVEKIIEDSARVGIFESPKGSYMNNQGLRSIEDIQPASTSRIVPINLQNSISPMRTTPVQRTLKRVKIMNLFSQTQHESQQENMQGVSIPNTSPTLAQKPDTQKSSFDLE